MNMDDVDMSDVDPGITVESVEVLNNVMPRDMNMGNNQIDVMPNINSTLGTVVESAHGLNIIQTQNMNMDGVGMPTVDLGMSVEFGHPPCGVMHQDMNIANNQTDIVFTVNSIPAMGVESIQALNSVLPQHINMNGVGVSVINPDTVIEPVHAPCGVMPQNMNTNGVDMSAFDPGMVIEPVEAHNVLPQVMNMVDEDMSARFAQALESAMASESGIINEDMLTVNPLPPLIEQGENSQFVDHYNGLLQSRRPSAPMPETVFNWDHLNQTVPVPQNNIPLNNQLSQGDFSAWLHQQMRLPGLGYNPDMNPATSVPQADVDFSLVDFSGGIDFNDPYGNANLGQLTPWDQGGQLILSNLGSDVVMNQPVTAVAGPSRPSHNIAGGNILTAGYHPQNNMLTSGQNSCQGWFHSLDSLRHHYATIHGELGQGASSMPWSCFGCRNESDTPPILCPRCSYSINLDVWLCGYFGPPPQSSAINHTSVDEAGTFGGVSLNFMAGDQSDNSIHNWSIAFEQE
jgi:hypothetical protein